MSSIRENLEWVLHTVAGAAQVADRNPEEIKIIAVSKTFSSDAVLEAAAAGQWRFGENRIQEAAAKIPLTTGAPGLEWHLVGHLQGNKARKAAQLFDWIHSVDSVPLLLRLNTAAQEIGKNLPVLIQLDLAGEPAKSGLREEELDSLLDAALSLHHVSIRGLMLLPPFFEDPEEARPFFRRLREIRDARALQLKPFIHLSELSMGMSHDFEVAIQEGATMVRIGTAVFGGRVAARV